MRIKKTLKQVEAVRLIANNRVTLLEGGGRSGKTYILLWATLVRALRVQSRHLVCRFRFNHAKQSICYETMPRLLGHLGLQGKVRLNREDWFYQLPNGSTIWIGGLDDKERTEKILGNEYATILTNEASQISWGSCETLLTRLNPPPGLRAKWLIDYNPPSVHHWGYQIFHKRRFPDGRPVPDGDFAVLRINPGDNPHLSSDYLQNLSLLSAAKRRRFLEGEYAVDAGKLWRRSWIRYSGKLPDMERVVIGVDPSGSVEGDEIGIVADGMCAGRFYCLDDYSLHGTPAEWAAEVASAYERWKADLVVAESNFGGDMVAHTIQTARPGINVRLVHAARGKVVRAEPISALYEHGRVEHREELTELEDEMCLYDPATAEKSPNRMDAHVFAMTELSGGGASMLDVL